jgi:chromosome segregation ATPase
MLENLPTSLQSQQPVASDVDADEPDTAPSAVRKEVPHQPKSDHSELAKLRERLETTQKELQSAITQRDQACKESEDARAQLERMRKEITQLTNAYNAARDEIEKLRSGDNSKKAGLDEVQKRVSELEEALSKSCKENEASARRLDEMNERHAQLVSQLHEINGDDESALIDELQKAVCADRDLAPESASCRMQFASIYDCAQ